MVTFFGTVCLDRVRRIADFPSVGGYAEILHESLLLGGEAANSAVAAHRLGCEVELIGNPIGHDELGLLVRAGVEAEGIEASLPEALATPFCDVYVTDNGERTMFGYGFLGLGARTSLPVLTGSRGWVTVDPNLESAAVDLVGAAQQARRPVYLLDLDPLAAGLQPGNWWQTSLHVLDRPELAVERSRACACWGVLTAGARGVWLVNPDGNVVFLSAFEGGETVDSTGAGDAFRGGMLAGFDAGLPIWEAAVQGMAAGCLNCRALGGNAGAPTTEEVRQLRAEQPEVESLTRRACEAFAVSS